MNKSEETGFFARDGLLAAKKRMYAISLRLQSLKKPGF